MGTLRVKDLVRDDGCIIYPGDVFETLEYPVYKYEHPALTCDIVVVYKDIFNIEFEVLAIQ